MTTDKPEPMMSVEKAIVAIETIEVFHKTSDLCSEALPRVVDLIRSLDERARKAEARNDMFEKLHEAAGIARSDMTVERDQWRDRARAAEAQVAEQAKEIVRLRDESCAVCTHARKSHTSEQIADGIAGPCSTFRRMD